MTASKKKIAGKAKARKNQYDSAWKKIIRELFKYFLEFFFPDIYRAIDFSKGVIFLDKELNEDGPGSAVGNREADILVKVHLRDGAAQIAYIRIIIHIEVQGQPHKDFMERVFLYNLRAFNAEKGEKVPVISLAVLTDDDDNFRPTEYKSGLLGFELRMKIPTVKILDFKLKPEFIERLKDTANPMSMVVQAQLKSLEVKRSDDDTRFEVTKELIRQCGKKGYSREQIQLLMKFLDYVIRLPEAFRDRVKEVIKKEEEESNMEYMAIWERDALRKGERLGKREGKREGMKEGIKMTAGKMIKKGFDMDTIMEITGLDKKEIERLMSKTQ